MSVLICMRIIIKQNNFKISSWTKSFKFNTELIQEKDLKNVKRILSSTDFSIKNTDDGGLGSTLLHHVTTTEVCKELIMHGAVLDARDNEGRTPLHHAILYRRSLKVVRELLRSGASANVIDDHQCTPLIMAVQLSGTQMFDVVRELLQHGANPNIHDRQGYTLLTLALYKKDMNVIRELLEWGADINFRNKLSSHCFLMFLTPLSEAVYSDQECAKLFIKMTVMKYFDNNYQKIINLNNFSNNGNFIKLSSFLEECAYEVLQMKSFIINKTYSLFEYVVNGRKLFKPLYYEGYMFQKFSSDFPIYYDVIIRKIEPHLIRAQLFRKLRGLRIYVAMYNNESVNNSTGEDIYLNPDCSCKIAEYLNNEELSALIEAYSII